MDQVKKMNRVIAVFLLESLKIEAWNCFFIDLHSTNSLFEQTVSDACYLTIMRFQCVSFWIFVRF